jgi:hypothetical protein
MFGFNSVRRPADNPSFASFLVIASAGVLGLWAGEGFFAAKYGLRIIAGQLQPWWYSLFFTIGAVAVYVRSEGTLFRIGLILFVLRYALAVFEVTALSASYPNVELLLSITSSIAFFAAGWPAARRWARVASCVVFVVLIPVRYGVLESVTGVKSVISEAKPCLLPVNTACRTLSEITGQITSAIRLRDAFLDRGRLTPGRHPFSPSALNPEGRRENVRGAE